MGLDDRPAHRKPDSHSFRLRRVERFKESIGACGSKADSGILDCHADVLVDLFRANQQPSWPVLDVTSRVRSVADEVENALLELDAVTLDNRQVILPDLEGSQHL